MADFSSVALVLMDEVAQAVEVVKMEWDQTTSEVQERINEIQNCGKSGSGVQEVNFLPRLNGAAQDNLASLRSLQFRLEFLAEQLPTEEDIMSAQATLSSWKEQYNRFHSNLRNANLQAKINIRKAAQQEAKRATFRRRRRVYHPQTQLADKGWNDISSRKRYREPSTDTTTDGSEESTGVLKKAETEYKGHRSLLMHTRRLLTTMQRQDVMDRVIMVTGFLIFVSAVLYVASKRVGLLALQRKIVAAVKSGSTTNEDFDLKLKKSLAQEAPPLRLHANQEL
ncbi:hypothetical protein AXF42_Ash005181 [Apostasia shenzhenica]|uniref:Sec20 C-terminal domain-containing protein n=1 Tax=Apostasia shenzhenica TaxID=1088818 RepID=A0A2I0B8N8_9ASPA|nr:hypothetical protein AXF42_Ash005181 [Apostasia shenzhenica]